MKKESIIFSIFKYFAYGLAIVITLYPLLFMIFTAFKTPVEFARNFWLPSIKGFTLNNFIEVWFNYKFYIFFKNSLIASASATLSVTVLSVFAGYAFARLRFPFSDKIFTLILSVLFLPVFIYIIPLFIQMRGLKLTNSIASLLLVYTFFGLPQAIYIARNFFFTIPTEVSESAMVDGAGHMKVFTRIIIPLSKSAISCIVILNFMGNWGEYIWAVVSNTKDSVKTIPAALSYFTSMSNVFWWYQMAALSIAIIPIVTVYTVFNKYFIQGFVEGAVKG
jgi:raffinose/stachyose/melibiose transport system permease protein